jgi:hypothetical protein
MKFFGKSSAGEMVLEWLKAELRSERFSSELGAALTKFGVTDALITHADLSSEEENAARANLLRHYRNWLDLNIADYDWQQAELAQDDVGALRFIDYSYWNELSDNSRIVKRAAQNVRKGKIVFEVPNDGFFSIAKAVEAGESLPPIIAVINAENEPAELLEGHVRATGYVLARDAVRPMTAIIGIKKP